MMSRVGFKPNRPEGMTFLLLFLPDGRVAGYHITDKCDNYPTRLAVDGMEHRPNADGSWSYIFSGSTILFENSEDLPRARTEPELILDLLVTEIQLDFRPIHTEYEYSRHMTAESLEIGKKSGDMHWEQIAKTRGVIKLGDTTYRIDDCMSQRDHTHGIRDWTGVGDWFYFVIWFNERLALNPAAIVLNDGRMSVGGFIYRDGRNIPIRQIRVLSHEFRRDGSFPVQTELAIVDADSRSYSLTARPGNIVPLPFEGPDGRRSILVQSFGSFELDNIQGGYGSYEVLLSRTPNRSSVPVV